MKCVKWIQNFKLFKLLLYYYPYNPPTTNTQHKRNISYKVICRGNQHWKEAHKKSLICTGQEYTLPFNPYSSHCSPSSDINPCLKLFSNSQCRSVQSTLVNLHLAKANQSWQTHPVTCSCFWDLIMLSVTIYSKQGVQLTKTFQLLVVGYWPRSTRFGS